MGLDLQKTIRRAEWYGFRWGLAVGLIFGGAISWGVMTYLHALS